MVKWSPLFLLLVLISLPLRAQTELTASLYNNPTATTESGKPIWLQLHTHSMSPSLRDIDLSELRTHYFVDSTADITVENNQQRWLLRLYPYQRGQQIIPALQYNHNQSKPLTISIIDPIDPKSGRPINVFTKYSYQQNASVWIRQLITVSYVFHTDNRYSQIRFSPPSASVAAVKSFKLPARQLDSLTYQHQLGWAIQPTKQGMVYYDVPPLQYVSDGVVTHTFYHPPLSLNVQSLPLYVPATMPVGRLSIHNNDAWLFSFTHSLSEWRFTLQGEGLGTNAMPDVNAAIVSTSDLRSYPAILEQTEGFTENGMATEINYRIPFKAIAQGINAFTPVKLDFFDPHSGRINSLTLQPPYILSLRSWLAFVLALFLLLIAYRMLKQPVKTLYRRLLRYRLYRQTLIHMQFTTDANDLRQCLRQFAVANGLSDNVSINHWLQSYTDAPESAMSVLAKNVNDFLFNQRTTIELPVLRQDIQHFCRKYQQI